MAVLHDARYARGMASTENGAAGEIVELRRRLRVDENSLLDRYAGRIDAVERGRPFFVGGAVLGAALTGLGRLADGTLSIVVTTAGILLAAIFGALVGWADFRKLEISREARNAMSIADEALDRAAAHADALDDQVRHRRRRDDRLEAAALMRESIGAAVASGIVVGEAITAMLDVAKLRLVAAFGFEAAEYWAITIFSPDMGGGEMVKVATLWNDATRSTEASRGWRKGEGFTGVAWRNESPVVVSDMTSPGMDVAYPVPGSKHRDHDRMRYRSAASYPVIVAGEVWGVVTATSNRAGRFDLATPQGTEAIRTVQDIADHVGLLATIERYVRTD